MDEVFAAVPGAHEAFSAVNHLAGETVITAGSVDHQAHVAAAGAALGAIGAGYLAAYAPAQANNLAATLLVGNVHHAIGLGTTVSKATVFAFDQAIPAFDQLA